MQTYPDVVGAIVNDYLDRLKLRLQAVPAREQIEFLREIESHIFEAYRQAPGDGDLARMLGVLRNLGEPSEVVADRLSGTMVRSGTWGNLPLHLIAGLLIALFGIPLGFGGVVVLAGILLALTWFVLSYYAAMGAALVAAAIFACAGLMRLKGVMFLERLESAGLIRYPGPLGQAFEQSDPITQGTILLVIAGVLLAVGLGLLWGGRHLVRGLRFLYSLAFDSARRVAQSLRRRLPRMRAEGRSLKASVYGRFNAGRPIPL